MKKQFLCAFLLWLCCSSVFSQTALPVNEFYQKITDSTDKTLIDVRTPTEYAGGHVAGFSNLDWNESDFKTKAALLPKNRPLYVYCLSGGRSGALP